MDGSFRRSPASCNGRIAYFPVFPAVLGEGGPADDAPNSPESPPALPPGDVSPASDNGSPLADSGAPPAEGRRMAAGFKINPSNINNYITWSPQTFHNLDFSQIHITEGMDFSMLRSYFALAIILFYDKALQEKHKKLYGKLQKAWVNNFGTVIDDNTTAHPPTLGIKGFNEDEVTWLLHTRRFLKTQPSSIQRRSSKPVPTELPPKESPSASHSASRARMHSQLSSKSDEASKDGEKKRRSEETDKHISRFQLPENACILIIHDNTAYS